MSSQGVAQEKPWWRRGWALVSGAILALGALASAITAILGLVRAEPDLVDRAEITFIDLIPAVPLSQYERRSAGGPRSLGEASDLALAAHVVLTTTGLPQEVSGETDEPPVEGTTGPSPTSPSESPEEGPSESPASPSEPTSESPSESPAESPTPSPSESPGGLVTEPPFAFPLGSFRYRDVVAEVRELAPQLELPRNPDGETAMYVLNLTTTGVDEEGEPLPPAEAARRVVQVLGETRAVRTPQGTLDPLGVVVFANVELEGLRDREVGVFWELWSRDGGTQLYDRWLDQVPVSRITAQRDTDAGSLRFWVPMPKDPGQYVVNVILREGESTLVTRPSGPFG
jgi:hypothetical protein